MINIKNTEVWGWAHAIRGMRNPMNSWEKSDSFVCEEKYGMTDDEIAATCGKCPRESCNIYDENQHFILGTNDLTLMRKLISGGAEHRKFLRQVFVSVDITAPLYWWKEFSTYKVGTVENSCSTMHKIHAKEFELDDFSHDHVIRSIDMSADEMGIVRSPMQVMLITLSCLNTYRELYLDTHDKRYWWQLIQLLPSSYNQKRTLTMSYENLLTMYRQRKEHKLDEWRSFCDWVMTLPYARELFGEVSA